ncbi:hypothetical protein FQ154_09260 [Paeniglutamicibacter gangotriensis]|uniref:DUF3726 domain-containing protein n=1 Tax=Paeniglutamicibacter gangotriensis TaxID=254787 RepID=A0A5B0EDG2_9MICC|nr:hypothetical protein [Paeniglutamicibacter gangotriensis]KAA0977084.1 hypothetical protein FQ154_09260 [Paeniglutamicibacter gangotriensis]
MTVTTQKGAPMETGRTASTMRVALREVRECAYRTLMAKGASNAEAQAAARQVLFAEVHYGTGLAALASWLRKGSWTLGALSYTRTETPEGKRYAVDPGSSCHALVHGVLLVDVASSGVGSEVLCNAVNHDSHLLDEALLNAAQVSGHTVVHRSAGASNRTTFATPDGELGTGFSSDAVIAPRTAPEAPYGSRFYTVDSAPQGDFVRCTEAERAARRVDLAHSGIQVDSAIWAELRAVAAGYLVGEA